MNNPTPFKVLITGGSGYLGRALTEYLLNEGYLITWVSRNASTSHPEQVTLLTYRELASTNQTFDIIINLAGAGIADKRWTDTQKQALLDSRLQPTQAVLDYIDGASVKPKLFISGSAIGWYGAQITGDNTVLEESSSSVKQDYAHELCDKWEKLALTATNFAPNMPVAIIRTGVVLSGEGGMIEKLKLPFSLGLGGKLGSGKQVMSWISLTDWVRAVAFILENNLNENSNLNPQQIYNLTAPNPITNKEFTKAVGNWLNRPTIFAQPESLLTLIFGEMATLLIDGQNVYPQALLALSLESAGFEFKDRTVISALQSSILF